MSFFGAIGNALGGAARSVGGFVNNGIIHPVENFVGNDVVHPAVQAAHAVSPELHQFLSSTMGAAQNAGQDFIHPSRILPQVVHIAQNPVVHQLTTPIAAPVNAYVHNVMQPLYRVEGNVLTGLKNKVESPHTKAAIRQDLHGIPLATGAAKLANNLIVSPFLTGAANLTNELGGRHVYHGTPLQQLGQAGGDVLNTAGLVYAPVKGVEAGLKGASIGAKVIKGAKAGAKIGAAYGGAQGLTNSVGNGDNLPQTLLNTGTGAVVGTGVGALGGAAAPVAGAAGKAVVKGVQGFDQSGKKASISTFINYLKNPPADRATNFVATTQGLSKSEANKLINKMDDPTFKATVQAADQVANLAHTANDATLAHLSDTNPQLVAQISHYREANNIPNIASPTKTTGLTTGIQGSPEFSPALKQAVQGDYTPFTNKAATTSTEEFMKQPLQNAQAQVMQSLSHYDNSGGEVGQRFTGNFGKQEVSNAGAVMKALDAKGDVAGAQAIHDLLRTKLLNAGQTGQAAQLIYNRTPEGLRYMAQRELSNAKVPVTPALQSQIDAKIAQLKNLPEGRAQDKARAEFAKMVGEQIPTSAGKKVVSLYKTGILSSPKTAVKVGIVNPITTTLENIADIPASIIDKGLSLATGKRTVVGPTINSTKIALQHVPEALSNAKIRFKDDIVMPHSSGLGTAELSNIGSHAHGANFGVKANGQRSVLDKATHGVSSKALNLYTSSIGRVHGALQAVPYTLRYNQSLAQQAEAQAITKGLKGAEKQTFIDNLVKSPSKQMVENADKDAQYSTSQQHTALGQAASGLQKTMPGGQFIVPITRIPGAVATQVVNYSPAGFLKTAGQAIVDKAHGQEFNQRDFAKGLGRATVGSGLTVGGAALMAQGRMSGDFPHDKATQALWNAANIPANSIYVGGKAFPNEPWKNTGGTWQQVGSPGGPAAQAALTGGAAFEGYKASGAAGAAQQGLSGGARIVTDQPYLTGVSGAMNAINNPAQSKSFYDQLAGSVVPNFIRDFAGASDPLQRQTSVQSPITSMKNAITNGIPGVREGNQPKMDVFGNTIPRNNGPLTTLLNPFNPQTNNNSPITDALGAIHNTQDVNGKPLSIPTEEAKKINIKMADGTTKPISDQQRTTYIQQSGQASQDAINKLINTPQFKQFSAQQQSDAIKKIVDGQRNLAKTQIDGSAVKLTSDGKAAQAGVLPTLNAKGNISTSGAADPKVAYQQALSKFQAAVKAGSLTPEAQYKQSLSLGKQAITSNFPNEVNTLYGMSKTELNQFLAQNPNKQSLLGQVYQLDKQLADNGFISKEKFGGTIAAKGSSRGGKSVASASKKYAATQAKLARASMPKLKAPKVAKIPRLGATKSTKIAKIKPLIGKGTSTARVSLTATPSSKKGIRLVA